MTVQLSSLRVSADFDASAYVRGMQAKIAADQAAAASSGAAATAIKQVDTAVTTSGGAIGRLSSTYIDGYATSAKFEKSLRDLSRAMETGNATSAQAGSIYTAMAQRFGIAAEVSALVAKNQLQLATVVAQANQQFALQNDVLARNAAVAKNASANADLQKTFGFTSQADKQANALRQVFGVTGQMGEAAKKTAGDFNTLRTAVDVSTKSHQAHGEAVTTAYQAQQESQHVIRAVTDLMMAGQSPARALEFEMTRIAEIISAPGGINNLLDAGAQKFRAIGKLALSAANPLTLFGGVVIGVGAAFTTFQSRQDEMQRALQTTGREAGLSLSQLNALAEKGTVSGRVSTSSAQSLAGRFVGANISTDLVPDAIKTTDALARTLGISFDEASKKMSLALGEPKKGLQDLGKEIGAFNAATEQTIERLDSEGDRFRAQAVALDSIKTRLSANKDLTWTWTNLWKGLGDAASNALAKVGQFAQANVAPTLEQRYAAVSREIDAQAAAQALRVNRGTVTTGFEGEAEQRRQNAIARSGRGPFSGVGYYDPRRASVAPAASPVNMQNALALGLSDQAFRVQQSAQEAEATRISNNLVSILRAPETEAFDRVDDKIKNLDEALKKLDENPFLDNSLLKGRDRIMGREITGSELTQQTDEILKNAQQTRLTAYQRETHASQIAVAQTQARTLADHMAVSAAEVTLQFAGREALTLERSNALREKNNQLLAEANAQAGNALLDAKQRRDVAGLPPEQAAILRQQYEDENNRRRFSTGGMVGGGSGGGGTTQAGGGAGAAVTLPPNFGLQYAPGAVEAARATAQAANSNSDSAWSGALDLAKQQMQIKGSADGKIDPAMQNSYAGNWGWARSLAPDQSDPAALLRRYNYAPPPTATTRQINQWMTEERERTQRGEVAQASRGVDSQNAMAAVQLRTIGQNVQVTTEQTKRQEMLNTFAERGVNVTGELAAKIDDYAKKAGIAAKVQQDVNNRAADFNEAYGAVRGGFRDIAGTVGSDILAHKKPRDIWRDVQGAAANKFMNYGLDTLTNSLFGRSGQQGTGLFGPLLSGGLGSKSADPWGIGGSGAAGAGGIGSLFSGIGSLFGFSEGGIMTSRGPLPLHRYAGGGIANSPQLAMIAEGGVPEAYVPVPAGKIPVHIANMPRGGGDTHVTNIAGTTINYAPPAGGSEADQRTQLKLLSALIDQKNADLAKRERTRSVVTQRRIARGYPNG